MILEPNSAIRRHPGWSQLPSQFRLVTLGAPQLLSSDGEAVRFRTRKHFAVLIRLAVEPGRPLTRDCLIDFLWSDAPGHLARHSLAQALSVLKAKLGHDHVVIRKGTVALVERCIDADVGHLGACDVEIRGRFLEGFEIHARPFEEWKDAWHARLLPGVRDCLVKQMDAGRRIGDFATVERRAQTLLDLDPLSEDAVRGLIEARAWVGDRSNALKVFARYEARLAEELQAKPSGDLIRVTNLLREGRRTTPHGVAPDAAPSHVPISHEKRFESETLIGREREFSQLYDAWLAARRREPRVMVVLGDPGVGKTTLCNAYASSCQMEGAIVARAQAYDAERELPFAVLAELVKQLTIQRAIGSADPEALSELSRITGEIFTVFPGVPKPIEWSAEVTPLRLADAFLKAIVAAAEENPVVLVVDDVHSVDNASAAILHLVARKLPKLRLVLILAGRSSELRSAQAPAALASDATIEGLRTVELDPLSPEASARLLAVLAAAGHAPLTGASASRILQAGNGNPLAIELLTKEWQIHGAGSLLQDLERLNTLPAAAVGIPRAIKAVFERQMQRFSAETRSAMDLAAVLGRRLTELSLYQAADLSAPHAGEALSRLLEEGVLREVHGDLEFRNELIRAQAYYAVSGPARQHLHRRVAELLAGRGTEDGESLKLEIAWHYLRGGDPVKALPFALEGAEEALEVGAPREAEEVLAVSLRFGTQMTQELRAHLLLSKALLDQSNATASMPILNLLEATGNLTSRDRAEVARMRAFAEHLLNAERGERHLHAADQALSSAVETGDKLLIAQALFEYARSGAESGDETRVRMAFNLISDLLEGEEAQQLPTAHYAQGFCLYYLYEAARAGNAIRKAIALLKPTNNPVQLSLAYTGLGNCLRVTCDLDGSTEAFEIALSLAKRIGNDSRASIITGNIVALLLLQGRYAEAILVGKNSIELGNKSLSQPFLSSAYMNLAEAHALLGEIDQAIACRDAADSWLRQERSWRSRIEFYTESASLELIMGNLSSCLDLTRSAERLAEGRERAVPPQSSLEMLRTLRLAHEVGNEEALNHVQGIVKRFEKRMPIEYLNALSVKAWLERRMGGEQSVDTIEGLKLFDALRIPGQKRLMQALGFLL